MSITYGDIMMIDHYINERGDITRWSSWEDRKEDIMNEFPELVTALQSKDIIEKTIERIVNDIVTNAHLYSDE